MAKVNTIPVIAESNPAVVAYINADAAIPDGYDAPTTRTVTDPQSPATVLGWLTTPMLCEIAAESGIVNAGSMVRAALITEILTAKGMVRYDAGTPLGATSGQATLDGGSITVLTTAVTATCQVVLTPSDAPDGRLYVSDRSAGVSFAVASTEITDDCRVDWMIVEP